MKAVLRPYQYVYVSANDNEILFYDMLEKQIYTYKMENFNCNICGGNVIINAENLNSLKIISDFRTKQMGEFVVSNAIIHFDKYASLRRDYNDIIENEISPYFNPCKFIFEIDVCYDCSLSTLLLGFDKKHHFVERVSWNEILNFIQTNDFSSLAKMRLILNREQISKSALFIEEMSNRKINIEILCSIYDIKFAIALKQKYEAISINCILKNGEIECLNECLDDYDSSVSSYIIIIQNTNDIERLERLNIGERHRVDIVYSTNASLDFLKGILSYSYDQVAQYAPNDIKSIVEKEFINKLNWGKIILTGDGKVYSSVVNEIGSLSHTNFDEIINRSESLWFKTRCSFSYCRDCIMRNLCPPLTLVEMKQQTTFCHE